MRKLAFAGIFLLLVGGAALLGYSNFKKIEKRTSGAPISDIIVVDANMKSAAATIVKTFTMAIGWAFPHRTNFPHKNNSTISSYGTARTQFFPDDIQLGFHVRQDPALRRYSELSAGARSTDFYLYEPSGDYYCNLRIFLQRCAGEIPLRLHNPPRATGVDED